MESPAKYILFSTLLFLCALLPAGPVQAQTRSASHGARENLFTVSVIGGAGSPLGYLGLEAGVDLSPSLQISIGGGRAEGGYHGALTTRFRFWSRGEFFSFLGAGGSYGRAIESPLAEDHAHGERFAVEHGFYVNTEMGVGWRLGNGAQLMWVLGFATLVNRSEATCVENCTFTAPDGTMVPTSETQSLSRVTPYLAVHIGMTF